MKATLLLLLITSVAGNMFDEVEDVSNRRHALFQKAHGRRVQEEAEATGEATSSTSTTTTSTSSSSSSSEAAETEEEVDESVTIQLTRTPTKGTSTSKRTAPKKPTSTASTTTNKQKSDDAVSDTVPTTPAESKRESNENTRVSAMVTDLPTYMPSYVPTAYTPTVEPSGKARKVDPDNYDDDSIITRTKSGKTDSGGGKGGKGSNPTSNVCEKRFDLAWEANVKVDYAIADTKTQMKEQCAFDTTNTAASPFAPNLSCPFIYTPDTGFLDNETAVVNYFLNITGSDSIGIAFWLFQLYCGCDLGINEQCLDKVPTLTGSSPEGNIPYCTFAGIWNGDFALNNYFDLDNDVQTCGCYFVSVEQLGVDNCPGVDLGAFFVNPANTTRR
ncbi:hypothetical protein ACHAW6_015445 [Cyclotella cf. meneghiniana]